MYVSVYVYICVCQVLYKNNYRTAHFPSFTHSLTIPAVYLVVGSIDLALRGDVQLLPEYKGALHHVLHALVAPEIPAQKKGFIQSYI